MARRRAILLLRQPGEPDPYVAAFEARGFAARCLPVLRFEFVNEEALRERLARPGDYGGLVLTSRRAVEAVERAGPVAAGWRGKVILVAGPATAAAAERIGLRPAERTGTGASGMGLAVHDEAGDGPVLYLAGDRRRGELPRDLAGLGVSFEEVTVYRTHLQPPDLGPEPPDWAAFFSPSGVEAALAAPGFPWNSVSRAAIGPTTADALRAAGHPPAAVAAAPTPEHLVLAVTQTPHA